MHNSLSLLVHTVYNISNCDMYNNPLAISLLIMMHLQWRFRNLAHAHIAGRCGLERYCARTNYNIIRMRNLSSTENGTLANVRRALSSFELHNYIAIAGISSARFLEYPASLCGSSDERAAPVVGLLSCASCI